MAFTPRVFEDILDDMVAYMQANTAISDFTPGSVIRTILEAAATEDDEQYYQMVQLLDMFSYTTASGSDLDRRLADFGLYRLQAKSSTCRGRFFNKNLITSQLSLDALAGATSIQVFNISVFPTPAPTYTVRIGEGTTRVQDVTVNAINTTTGVLTLSTPLIYDVYVGDRVSYVGTDSFTINLGTMVRAPATVAEGAKIFVSQEPAYILAGNYFSNEIILRSQNAGINQNTAARRISQFVGSPPFPGAGFINHTAASGGRDRESDSDFRQRAINQLQSLSKGTPLALINSALGVTDAATGQRVVSSNIIEDFANDEVIIYIDDGTGFTPDFSLYTTDSLAANAAAGATTIQLNNSDDFPSSGNILILTTGSEELRAYSQKNTTTDILTLTAALSSNHTSGDIVLLVDILSSSTEIGQSRFRVKNIPVIRSTFRLFINQGLSWQELTENTDFKLNRGNGELQLTIPGGIAAGSVLVANYSYYTNLIAETQRVLEGDLDNPTVYPGVKAAGIFLSVEAPLLKRITVRAVITAELGFNEDDLVDLVKENIEAYINTRKIGEDVILSRIIDVAHNVPGVKSISVTTPTNNITVLENELPVAFDSTGDSLVTVL